MNAVMLISRAKARYKIVDAHKVSSGQFNTAGDSWLRPQITDFIKNAHARFVLDPFAGRGDILKLVKARCGLEPLGYDVDAKLPWPFNDSLKKISPASEAIIITNPPFLAKHSARRKGVHDNVQHYYHTWDDLYLQALDCCRAACERVVAIVPETFLNCSYPKTCCHSITIIEDNPFADTDCPVCVLCVDRVQRNLAEVSIFVGDDFIGTWEQFNAMRLHPTRRYPIIFNDPRGKIGLRAVDLPDAKKPIRFYRREDLDYAVENVKVSSRLVTFISAPAVVAGDIERVVESANQILADFRKGAHDVILSPFMGNTQTGRRRRRLDYYTARAILEQAIDCIKGENCLTQSQLVLWGKNHAKQS